MHLLSPATIRLMRVSPAAHNCILHSISQPTQCRTVQVARWIIHWKVTWNIISIKWFDWCVIQTTHSHQSHHIWAHADSTQIVSILCCGHWLSKVSIIKHLSTPRLAPKVEEKVRILMEDVRWLNTFWRVWAIPRIDCKTHSLVASRYILPVGTTNA